MAKNNHKCLQYEKGVSDFFFFIYLSYFEYRQILPNKIMDLSPFEHHRKILKKEKKQKQKLDPRPSLGIQCGERDLGSRGTLAPSSTFS